MILTETKFTIGPIADPGLPPPLPLLKQVKKGGRLAGPQVLLVTPPKNFWIPYCGHHNKWYSMEYFCIFVLNAVESDIKSVPPLHCTASICLLDLTCFRHNLYFIHDY